MSIAETYLLASKARTKLTNEASKQDHDLRVLVCHANLLDNLMETIHDYKFPKQQDSKQSIQPVSILDNANFTPSRLQHTTTVSYIDDDDDSDSDSDSDSDDWESDLEEEDEIVEEDYEDGSRVSYTITDSDSEEEEEEDEEDMVKDEVTKDEDPWRVRFSLPTFTTSHEKLTSGLNFRQLPTIDELSEVELQSMESESENEEEEEEEEESDDEGVNEVKEADIVDMIHSNQPPQLSYSTTDESESESEEEEEEVQKEHDSEEISHHDKYQKDRELLFHKHIEDEPFEINSNTVTRATICS